MDQIAFMYVNSIKHDLSLPFFCYHVYNLTQKKNIASFILKNFNLFFDIIENSIIFKFIMVLTWHLLNCVLSRACTLYKAARQI